MIEILLPKATWWFDDSAQLGPPGGFGVVFRGWGADGQPVAVKRLQSEYQAREMQIADFLLGHGLPHVIPILDVGFDTSAGTNFIVMPIATMSLQQHITRSGPLGAAEALEILGAIAAGLDEVGDIIHRDLKPGNVLLHEGVWKLADLGLARFAEVATSSNTMRDSLTPQYAAPEQWRGERPSKATDVYAFGCVVHALVTGAPPFSGPETSDFSQQHQFVAPTSLSVSPHVRRLAAACLAKSPELRPSIAGLRGQLANAVAALAEETYGLAAAAAMIAEESAREEEERLQRQQADERRELLALEANQILQDLFQQLEEAVLREAPNAARQRASFGDFPVRRLRLGRAALDYGSMFRNTGPGSWQGLVRLPNGADFGSRAWDVMGTGYVSVQTTVHSYRRGRSSNLLFARLIAGDIYRWWEVCYTDLLRRPKDSPQRGLEPFAIEFPTYGELDCWIAEEPRPVTPDFVSEFLERWIGLFARASVANDHAADELFPENVDRASISSKFELDKP